MTSIGLNLLEDNSVQRLSRLLSEREDNLLLQNQTIVTDAIGQGTYESAPADMASLTALLPDLDCDCGPLYPYLHHVGLSKSRRERSTFWPVTRCHKSVCLPISYIQCF